MRRDYGKRRYCPTIAEVTCTTGKRPYADIHAAREFARRTSRQRDEAMQPYRCLKCLHWHVGTHVGTIRKPRPEPLE